MYVGNGKRFSTEDGPRQPFEVERTGQLPDTTKDHDDGQYVASYPTDDKDARLKLESMSTNSRLSDWLQNRRRLVDRRVSFVEFLPRSRSCCLSLALCLQWYNGLITLREH